MTRARRASGKVVVVAVVVAGLLGAAACSDDDPEAAPHNTVQVLTTTTTTNPYAPPAVIDVAYVNRVLAGLDQVVGEVVRRVVGARAITPEAEEFLRALYSDEDHAFADHQEILAQNVKTALGNVRPAPGNQVTSVTKLLSVSPNCIFAEVRRDLSAVVYETTPDMTLQWVALKPLDRSRDPKGLNPTAWMYIYDGFPASHIQPADPCA